MTRPTIHDKPMEERVVIRVTPDQKKSLEEAAKRHALTLSRYIRHVAMKAARLGWF